MTKVIWAIVGLLAVIWLAGFVLIWIGCVDLRNDYWKSERLGKLYHNVFAPIAWVLILALILLCFAQLATG